MIYILSQTTKKHQKTLFRPLHSKSKKIQGLFKDFGPKIQGLFQDCVNPIFSSHQQYLIKQKGYENLYNSHQRGNALVIHQIVSANSFSNV